MTYNYLLNKDNISHGKKINFSLNNKEKNYSIVINESPKTYTDIEKDVTIIELNSNKDNINDESFLHIDKNISKKIYRDKTIL